MRICVTTHQQALFFEKPAQSKLTNCCDPLSLVRRGSLSTVEYVRDGSPRLKHGEIDAR
jgi:hypothetical protein